MIYSGGKLAEDGLSADAIEQWLYFYVGATGIGAFAALWTNDYISIGTWAFEAKLKLLN
ncbi:MAG: hypothetical protein ACXV8P_01090 [Methylobacter sp.]